MSSVSLGNLIPCQIGGFMDTVCLNEKYLILNLTNFILKKLDLLDILKIYNGKYKVMVAAKCYINRDHFEYFT